MGGRSPCSVTCHCLSCHVPLLGPSAGSLPPCKTNTSTTRTTTTPWASTTRSINHSNRPLTCSTNGLATPHEPNSHNKPLMPRPPPSFAITPLGTGSTSRSSLGTENSPVNGSAHASSQQGRIDSEASSTTLSRLTVPEWCLR